MPKKIITRPDDSAKTNSRNIEASFSIDSKIKNVKNAEMLSRLSPHIKLQMEDLFRHEEKIIKQLKDPGQMELFVKDPLKFFINSKIELSPMIKKRIELFTRNESFESKKFILPNGQVLKPRITINIKEK